MLIYIEDSGDPGLKVKRGSSKVFVLVMVIFEDDLDAEEMALKIKRLRQELKKNENFEFKFNKCSKRFRIRFLSVVSPFKFRARALVIFKDRVDAKRIKSKQSFYNLAIGLLLKYNKNTLKNAKLRLDGKGEREFRKRLLTCLRKELKGAERKVIKNLRFRNSKNDVLVQLADMIAGSVNRSFSSKKDAKAYFDIIKKKIEEIWIPKIFPQ